MLSIAEENDLLREQNRQLKEQLNSANFVFSLFRYFARNHLRMLDALSRHEIVSRQMFVDALYHDRHDADMPDETIVAVLMCSLRKKLKTFGIKVHTRYNVGWYLDAENKKKLATLCETERVAA